MVRTVVQVALNALALLLTARLVPGIDYDGGVVQLLLAGLVLGLVNLMVKPIATLLSLPLIVLTLGLFFLVVNGAMLSLVAAVVPGFRIEGCLPAILGGLVLAVFNWLVRAFEESK